MNELIPWAEAVTPVRERFGPLIAAASSWHDERGVSGGDTADPDLFALVCAGSLGWLAIDDPGGEGAPLVWTRIGVRALLRCGIPNWCTLSSATTWPLEVVPATWQWLDFLHQTGRLDPRSDPIWELRKPLICYGGLDFEGRWRPETDPSPIPCECYLPYRKTVEYLNERLEAGSLIGDVLFWDGPECDPRDADPARVGGRWTSERRGGASRADPRARPIGRAARRPRSRGSRPSRSDPG